MGISRQQALEVVLRAVEYANQEQPEGKRLPLAEETVLLGPESALDSMGVVSLVMDVEQLVSDDLGVHVDLADDRAMSRRQSPYRTVKSLTDYVCELVAQAND